MNKRFKVKTLVTAACVALVLAVVASASFFAIFASRQKAENSINTGIINVELQEEFKPGGGSEPPVDPSDPNSPAKDPDDPDAPPYKGTGAENAVKIIKGYNSGTQPAYVRVRLFPVVETMVSDSPIEWNVHGGIPANRVEYDLDDTGWIYSADDDYYYYSKILQPGETTPEMTVSNLGVDLNEAEQVLYGEDTLRVNMLVTLESSQASNGLWRQNWGIEALPVGVEQ